MHELGVVFHIADIVRDVAVENKATKIQKSSCKSAKYPRL